MSAPEETVETIELNTGSDPSNKGSESDGDESGGSSGSDNAKDADGCLQNSHERNRAQSLKWQQTNTHNHSNENTGIQNYMRPDK